MITNLTIGGKYTFENGYLQVKGVMIPLGILFYFVEVGLVSFMINFINDKKHELKDIFSYSNDYVRIVLTGLLQTIFIFLWSLLFVIPGIIKAYAYSLVKYLLADDKYKELSYTEIIKKSEEMMKGHKMEYFMLQLSFIGWHLLAIFTIGLLEIWIIPYQKTAETKFMMDLKENYKK